MAYTRTAVPSLNRLSASMRVTSLEGARSCRIVATTATGIRRGHDRPDHERLREREAGRAGAGRGRPRPRTTRTPGTASSVTPPNERRSSLPSSR